MHLRFSLIPLFLFPFFITAQIDQDFDLDSVDELIGWSGDLGDFLINDSQQLQLSATDNGRSTLIKPVAFSDQTEWNLYFNLGFAPSNSNQLKVYLISDSDNLDQSSGYFIEVGESGSQDNLEFYRQDNGDKVLLAEGIMGKLGESPANARLKVVRSSDNFWTIYTAYNNAPFVQIEFEFSDERHRPNEGYFALQCDYTETRKDKFFFDDFYVGDIKEDNDSPVLINTKFLDPLHISLEFNELISETSGLDIKNFSLDNNLGNPSEVTFGEFANQIILKLSTSAIDGEAYNISISNIEDLSGNLFNDVIRLYLTSLPQAGELIINEILFDPYPDGEDFVELYNTSSKHLDLDGLIFFNSTNERVSSINQNLILGPKQYVAITPDVEALYKYYMTQGTNNIIESGLPALSNSDGNISILLEGIDGFIDSYSYDESDHSEWIDDTEGVSLERVDPSISAMQNSNWQSASKQSGFATPGYQNSTYTQENVVDTEFLLEKKTFSPDADGFDDFLQINYRVEADGIVLNMKVFDDRGHLIRTIANNEILTRQGSVIWDGKNDRGTLASLGIYVIWLEYFNSEGTIGHKKLSCVLAKQLN